MLANSSGTFAGIAAIFPIAVVIMSLKMKPQASIGASLFIPGLPDPHDAPRNTANHGGQIWRQRSAKQLLEDDLLLPPLLCALLILGTLV